jgi:hypothetical protein
VVSADALAKWAALHAHKHAGMWVVLMASALGEDFPLEVVESRDDFRLARDMLRDEHVFIRVPKEIVRLGLSLEYEGMVRAPLVGDSDGLPAIGAPDDDLVQEELRATTDPGRWAAELQRSMRNAGYPEFALEGVRHWFANAFNAARNEERAAMERMRPREGTGRGRRQAIEQTELGQPINGRDNIDEFEKNLRDPDPGTFAEVMNMGTGGKRTSPTPIEAEEAAARAEHNARDRQTLAELDATTPFDSSNEAVPPGFVGTPGVKDDPVARDDAKLLAAHNFDHQDEVRKASQEPPIPGVTPRHNDQQLPSVNEAGEDLHLVLRNGTVAPRPREDGNGVSENPESRPVGQGGDGKSPGPTLMTDEQLVAQLASEKPDTDGDGIPDDIDPDDDNDGVPDGKTKPKRTRKKAATPKSEG